jgi:hypothetical protein
MEFSKRRPASIAGGEFTIKELLMRAIKTDLHAGYSSPAAWVA